MTRRYAILAVLAALALINGWALWRGGYFSVSGDDEYAREMERRLERQRRQVSWESHPVVPLESGDLRHSISQIKENNCTVAPSGSEPLSLGTLSNEQREELYDAVSAFLHAYAQDNPDAVLRMMKSRGLTFSPARVTLLRKALVKSGHSTKETAEAMSSEDVYRLMWTSGPHHSSMSGLIVESSCITLFNATGLPATSLKDYALFTDWVPKVWKGISTLVPNFTQKGTQFEDIIARASSPVLVADLTLILDNSKTRLSGKTPYLVRLWFNPQEKKWQPLLFAAVLLEEVQIGRLMF
jgi:hypothetical protein